MSTTRTRSYIFSTHKTRDKERGCINVRAKVYRIVSNQPKIVSIVLWDTHSYSGDKSEVFAHLQRVGEIASRKVGMSDRDHADWSKGIYKESFSSILRIEEV